METPVIIDPKFLQEIKADLSRIERKINELLHQNKMKSLRIFNNADFCDLLKISKRTAQMYRDKGLIEYSQEGKKIHYTQEAIETFLKSRKHKTFLK